MFHIEHLSWDEEDSRLWSALERRQVQEARSNPCEDDYEEKCPFIGMLPEESGKEEGSPLAFGEIKGRDFVSDQIDRQIELAMKLGLA